MHAFLRGWIPILGLTLAIGACRKGDDSCKTLTNQVAQTAGLPADKVAVAIDKELTGPSGEALKGEQRESACKMILSDKDALEGYSNAIKSRVAK